MDQEATEQHSELKTMMRLLCILDAAGDRVLGKGAPAIMYQAGRDEGISRAQFAGRVTDPDEALSLALTTCNETWQVEPWKVPGEDAEWMKDGDRRSVWLIFHRCPLMELAHRVGSSQGGLLCWSLHGYMAGSMERMLGCRVDMRVGHCGPGACKILLETRS